MSKFYDDVDFSDLFDINGIGDTLDDISDSSELKSDPFIDKYSTHEQKIRDEHITKLLKCYVDSYENKTNSNKIYKCVLFWVCMAILALFSIFFICTLGYILCDKKDEIIFNYLSTILPICITYLTLVISILKIIVKYIFPENEEEYITGIVEIIEKNDLENKKENIKSNHYNTDNKK